MTSEKLENNVYVLGVCANYEETSATIFNQNIQLLGRDSSTPLNRYSLNLEETRTILATVLQNAVDKAGITLDDISATTLAFAGIDYTSNRQVLCDLAAELLPDTPVDIVHTSVAALMGGLGSRMGIIAVVGSEMFVYGENKRGQSATVGGWGYLLEQGSSYHLGMTALRSITLAEDKMERATSLRGRIFDYLGLNNFVDLLKWVHDPVRHATDIVDINHMVIEEAEAGDVIAGGLVMQSVAMLADSVKAVAKRLKFRWRPFPIVLAGSLLANHTLYRKLAIQAVNMRLPHGRFHKPYSNFETGTALLALDSLNQPFNIAPIKLSMKHVPTPKQSNYLTQDLDTRSVLDIISLMYVQDKQAIASIRPTLPEVAEAIESIAEKMKQGGRLIYVGAGTSGHLGIIESTESPPLFDANHGQVIGIIAGGEASLTRAVKSVADNRNAGAIAMAKLPLSAEDSVVGVSASGETPYVVGALNESLRRGALTVAVTSTVPSSIANVARYIIVPHVGAEVLTGLSRLKAGTAQKSILNMISVGVMIRLGGAYGNLPMYVRPVDKEQPVDGKWIIAKVCNISESEAHDLLVKTNGDIKIAIVSHVANCTPNEAHERLKKADGMVRQALK